MPSWPLLRLGPRPSRRSFGDGTTRVVGPRSASPVRPPAHLGRGAYRAGRTVRVVLPVVPRAGPYSRVVSRAGCSAGRTAGSYRALVVLRVVPRAGRTAGRTARAPVLPRAGRTAGRTAGRSYC